MREEGEQKRKGGRGKVRKGGKEGEMEGGRGGGNKREMEREIMRGNIIDLERTNNIAILNLLYLGIRV